MCAADVTGDANVRHDFETGSGGAARAHRTTEEERMDDGATRAPLWTTKETEQMQQHVAASALQQAAGRPQDVSAAWQLLSQATNLRTPAHLAARAPKASIIRR